MLTDAPAASTVLITGAHFSASDRAMDRNIELYHVSLNTPQNSDSSIPESAR